MTTEPTSQRLVAEISRGGSGIVYRVKIGNVYVWTHPSHIDGPLSDDAKRLFDALNPVEVSDDG